MADDPTLEARSDLTIVVHECTLGPELLRRAERERLSLSASVDLLGAC